METEKLSINYKTLPGLLDYQVRQNHNLPFILFEDRRITYGEFDRVTNCLARGLKNLGIKKGQVVSIFAFNSPEYVITWFALNKIGAVMGPINVAFKADEVGYVLANSEAVAVVYSPALVGVMNEAAEQCPQLKFRISMGGGASEGTMSLDQLMEGRPDGPLEKESVGPQDIASIIYTSGTTGHPKGVQLTHWNYISDSAAAADVFPLFTGDVIMMILPLFHVNAQVATVMVPMMIGGTVAMLQTFNPADFWQAVEKYRAVTFSAVPTILSILMDAPGADSADFSSLRYIICGAAPLPVSLFLSFEEKFGLHILEGYGLTEGTCVSSLNPFYGVRKIGSIGLPLRGQQMVIKGEQGEILEADQYGEICIKGPNVMKGYYKNEKATGETIVDGWLHTGDVGYIDQDGYFWIVDRIKEMIIRGGENIYPREIEELLYRHPKVAEAAVIGHPSEKYGEVVKAVIVARSGCEVTEEEIKDYCREKIAKHKVPAVVAVRKKIKKTQTGKIVKKILRQQEKAME